MFVRVKSSVLGGAICSLLTVFIMCHILKLSVTPKYTHYLDSTEITNYTLIESLLLSKESTTTATPNSRSENIHQTLEELKHLATTSSSSSSTTATVIIQYHSLASLQSQLQAVQNQSKFHPSNVIHVVCDTEEEKSTIEQFLQQKRDNYKVSLRIEGKLWFQHISIDQDLQSSNYVILLEKEVVPGQHYFHFVIGLLNTHPFHHTLIGTEQSTTTTTTNICQQNEAHYVDALKDIYVLRREWYSALITSTSAAATISQSLLDTLHLPSVILPTSPTTNGYHGNTKSSCVNVSPNGLLFVKELPDDGALNELICQFSQKHDIVHLVAYGPMKTTLPSCSVSNTGIFFTHSVIGKVEELDRIITKISPSVVVYAKRENSAVQQLQQSEKTTFIGLPTKEISKVASWMTDLSLETLQKWHTPKIHLITTVGGGKRLEHVKTLFKSIQKASYLGDRVELSIVMDEKSDKSLQKFSNNLEWKHGVKNLRHRISGVHPMQIFAEAWYPTNDDEYAIMLDDRVELSNTFYIWLKYAVLKYRYAESREQQQQQQQQQTMFSISLYSPRVIDTDPSGRQLLKSPNKTPYLMQLPNSLGGALYFPEHWREFHDYITARLTDQATVKRGSGNPHLFKDSLLTVSRTNKWTSSWRKYFDEMIYMRGYVTLYPPFDSSFSTMTTVAKSSFNNNKKKKELYIGAEKLFKVPLIASSESIRELPDLELLPVLDLHGKLVESHKVLLERGHTLQRKFSACKPRVNHSNDPTDMLCPFNQWVTVPIEEAPTAAAGTLPKTIISI